MAAASANPWRERHIAAWWYGQSLAIVTVLVCARLVRDPVRHTLRVRLPPRWARPLMGRWIGATVVAYVSVSAACVMAWPGAGDASDPYAGLSSAILAHPLAFLVPVGVLAPIGEELLFRGFGVSVLGANGSRALAVYLTAACFAAAHVEPYKMVPTALLGFALARASWCLGSILPGVVVHVVVNGGAVTVAALAASHARMASPADAHLPAAVRIAGALLWGGAGIVASRAAWSALRRVEAAGARAGAETAAEDDAQARRDTAPDAMVSEVEDAALSPPAADARPDTPREDR